MTLDRPGTQLGETPKCVLLRKAPQTVHTSRVQVTQRRPTVVRSRAVALCSKLLRPPPPRGRREVRVLSRGQWLRDEESVQAFVGIVMKLVVLANEIS